MDVQLTNSRRQNIPRALIAEGSATSSSSGTSSAADSGIVINDAFAPRWSARRVYSPLLTLMKGERLPSLSMLTLITEFTVAAGVAPSVDSKPPLVIASAMSA